MVTAKAVGLALIVASATGCDVADTVEVKVTQVPAEVLVSPSSYTLTKGESYQFSGVVKDAMGYVIPGLEVVWSSDDASIASVDGAGIVTGLKDGTTQVRGVHSDLQGPATVTVTPPPPDGNGEPLFWDDFSTGDFSKHNDHFRWGSGTIQPPSGSSSMIEEGITGPAGAPVNAMKFAYGTWQEVRFHLTESVEEVRTADGASDVAHKEVWLRYWMRVPSNYYHRAAEHTTNNKGWFMLWKDSYSGGPASVHNEWYRNEDNTSRAIVIAQNATGQKVPSWRSPEHTGSGSAAYVFLTEEYGTWVDYAFRVKMRATAADDTHMVQVYKNGDLIIEWNKNNFPGATDLWTNDGDPSNAGLDRGYVMGYHNSGYNETTIFYITDFRYGHTGASVGITEQKAR